MGLLGVTDTLRLLLACCCYSRGTASTRGSKTHALQLTICRCVSFFLWRALGLAFMWVIGARCRCWSAVAIALSLACRGLPIRCSNCWRAGAVAVAWPRRGSNTRAAAFDLPLRQPIACGLRLSWLNFVGAHRSDQSRSERCSLVNPF